MEKENREFALTARKSVRAECLSDNRVSFFGQTKDYLATFDFVLDTLTYGPLI